MKSAGTIKIKAAFLLIIFGLNIMVGAACGAGVKFSFNIGHHENETAEIHIHKDGTKHNHKKQPSKHKEHSRNHSHNEKKDDCCTKQVVKISQEVKEVTQVSRLISPEFTSTPATFFVTNIYYPSQASSFHKYFVRGNHPPITDIRIAIQSFQI